MSTINWGRWKVCGLRCRRLLLERGGLPGLDFFQGRVCCRGTLSERKPGRPWFMTWEWGAGGDVACSPHRQSDMNLGDWCWGRPRLAAALYQA